MILRSSEKLPWVFKSTCQRLRLPLKVNFKMPEYFEITTAQYLEGYKIKLIFSDRAEVVVDFAQFLSNSQHPEIRKYLALEEFKKFQVRDGNLDWNDFDLCFPIADLYSGKVA